MPPTVPPDWSTFNAREVDSTNLEAVRILQNGAAGKFWIRAVRQTAGRGRNGRTWQSALGNLAVSYAFPTSASPSALPGLSLLTGVAVLDAVRHGTNPACEDVVLKWPNDILLTTAKAGGILLESTNLNGQVWVVAGVGLNIADAPGVEGARTAALAALLSPSLSLDDLAAAIARRLDHWLAIWDDGRSFQPIRDAWLHYGVKMGAGITTIVDGEPLSGTFAGLDASGALILRTEQGSIRRISVGDVALTD